MANNKIANGFHITFDILLIIATAIMFLNSVLFLYYSTLGKSELPTGKVATYVTTVTDQLTGESMPFLEVEYFANEKNNGKRVLSYQFNGYSDYLQQTVYSRGIQMVFDDEGEYQTYYYDGNQNVTFATNDKILREDGFWCDINGKTYGVKLDGTYTEKKFDGWKLARTILTLGINTFVEGSDMYKEVVKEYTFEDFGIYLMKMVISSSNGTGKSVIPLADLGSYLSIYEPNENNALPSTSISDGTNVTSQIVSDAYFTISTNYKLGGITRAKQSICGSVAGDNTFNISGIEEDKDFWQSIPQYTITAKDFETRYSQAMGGKLLVLDTKTQECIKAYSKLDLILDLNLDNISSEVVGFDAFCLSGFNLDSAKITSSTSREFYLLDGCFKDTGISTISTTNVVLTNYGDSGVTL